MATYIISYDLRSPGRNYEDLYERIRSYGTWAHITESTWAVMTTQTAAQVRDYVWAVMDNNDRLFVVKSGGEWGTYNLPKERNDWLRKYL